MLSRKLISIFCSVQEELLDETNKYDCPVCGSLQVAIRYSELRILPPVLNLQLLRFESSNGHSRKLSSVLKFPNKLDMNQFVKTSVGSNIYNLFAVLIHEGQTSHSGHYISFIKKGPTWFKFNDEVVGELKDFNLKIDSDEDFSDGGQGKKTVEKGYHQSKNAYMLVYRAESEPDFELPGSMQECNLPSYIVDNINEDNQKYSIQQDEELQKQVPILIQYHCSNFVLTDD